MLDYVFVFQKERRTVGGSISIKSIGKEADDDRTLATRDSRASPVAYISTGYYKEQIVAIKGLQYLLGKAARRPRLLG